ncbi:hypothetical protein [Streptomyces sp. NPDC056361]|uniref:hypothetical protein n=1 Tax=Streptomyces sp. NPDC056361 TaxID=3345795 RepID=UPI0035E390DE
MPLSVPLFLVPGEPNRHYTVHLHRGRWDVDAFSVEISEGHLTALAANVRKGLNLVSECVAAELADADVEVFKNPDGSAEAVARVLCTEEVCAAVAEQYRRDADEDVEAEAARAWAASQLQGQAVELLKLRDQSDLLPSVLAAALAVQPERTGGATDRIVLMLDEAAQLLRDNGLFTDRSPQGVRREIDRLVRQNRVMTWVESSDDEAASLADAGGGAPTRIGPEQVLSLPNWGAALVDGRMGKGKSHPMEDTAFMAPEHLVRDFEQLARQVAEGDTRHVIVARLVSVAGEAAARSGEEPRPTCPDRWPHDCEPDENPAHELLHRIGDRPEIVDVREARAAGLGAGSVMSLRTLPASLPADNSAAVLIYREDTPGLGLLNAVLTGNDDAIHDARTGLLRWLTAEGK